MEGVVETCAAALMLLLTEAAGEPLLSLTVSFLSSVPVLTKEPLILSRITDVLSDCATLPEDRGTATCLSINFIRPCRKLGCSLALVKDRKDAFSSGERSLVKLRDKAGFFLKNFL
jgi:hypothetical protein